MKLYSLTALSVALIFGGRIGSRNDLDEAMLFVFHQSGDKFVVIAHWADLEWGETYERLRKSSVVAARSRDASRV